MFCEVQATKHCNAQKHQLLPALKLTKHCSAQKFQNFKESAVGLAIDVRFLKFWEFLSITVFRELQPTKRCYSQVFVSFQAAKSLVF